jgi:TetR/AcrR family transcriptional regulator
MTVKEEIIDKSLELFVRVGYESTGVAKIVSEVGVTKPSLYHHFGNKEGLLESVIRQYGTVLQDIFRDQLTYKEDVVLALERFVIAYAGFVKRYPVFFRLYKQLYQSPEGSDSYRIILPLYTELVTLLELFFVEVALHHTNLKDKSQWMSYSLLGLMDTYLWHHLIHDQLESLDEGTCRQLTKQFLYGVFA